MGMRARIHGTSPFYNESSLLTDGTCSAFFPPPRPAPLHLYLKRITPFMATPQTRCRGCDKVFTHRGLALHLSKSQNSRCRRTSIALRDPLTSLSIPRMASLPPLDPPPASDSVHPGPGLGVGSPRDDLGASGIDSFDDLGARGIDDDVDMQSPDGMSAGTRVANQ